MSTVTELQVTGMTCEHCAATVTGALSGLPGVTGVRIGPRTDDVTAVTVTGDCEIDPAAALGVLDDAGYGLAGT
jgi:copper chaperone